MIDGYSDNTENYDLTFEPLRHQFVFSLFIFKPQRFEICKRLIICFNLNFSNWPLQCITALFSCTGKWITQRGIKVTGELKAGLRKD